MSQIIGMFALFAAATAPEQSSVIAELPNVEDLIIAQEIEDQEEIALLEDAEIQDLQEPEIVFENECDQYPSLDDFIEN